MIAFGKTVCPFPYSGGKGWIAEAVWARLGDVGHFVEPFCGSARMLLMRPPELQLPRHGRKPHHIETINDLDGFITNFWRAVQQDPSAVAQAAYWPVNEIDLIARRARLQNWMESAQGHLRTDPEWCDAKMAGWWCWAMSSAILGKWWCGRPALGNPGMGVNVPGRDVRQMMLDLSARLRHVRILCGDWQRVCTPSVLYAPGAATRHIGVFLDAPYGRGRLPGLYRQDDMSVAQAARDWAIREGRNPRVRIAMCGHVSEHRMPKGWSLLRWTRRGGRGNRQRECIWFSPHCLRVAQRAPKKGTQPAARRRAAA